MASLLDNLSVFHDEDQRSVADRGQTVGNDKTRSALHQLVKRLLNLQFGTGIDAGGRLVEDQHRRQAEHDTGDTKKLFFKDISKNSYESIGLLSKIAENTACLPAMAEVLERMDINGTRVKII